MKKAMLLEREPGVQRRSRALTEWPHASELDARCALLATMVPDFAYGGCRFTFLSCRANHSPPGTVVKPHRHSHYEIILILDGEARETTEPGHTIMAGAVQVHAPGEVHAWRSARHSLLRLGLCFTVQPPVPVRPPDAWPASPAQLDAARELLAETVTVAPGRRERLTARLVLALAPALTLFELPDNPASPHPTGSPSAHDIVAVTERFLADNLSEPLALEDVAAQSNVSVPTLTRRFRQETGSSVITRLQDLRLRRAADLLLAGERSIKEIAAAVGIPEPSYFSRCFRRAFGRTPGQFGAKGVAARSTASRRTS
jgi:AraC-like DNA-binding protein